MRIEVENVEAVAELMTQVHRSGEAEDWDRWCESRAVDPEAVHWVKRRMMAAVAGSVQGGEPLHVALEAAFLCTFQYALEAERCRRNLKELPTP